MEGPKTLKELKAYIKKDLKYYGNKPVKTFLSRYFFEPGFKYIVWLRRTRYCFLSKKKVLYAFCWIFLKHYANKYHFDISYQAQIGHGLVIAHMGYIIVMKNDIIGSNCYLRPGVVFGKKLTETTGGAVVGNNVSFGVGSVIVGNVTIGNNVIVGANSVITKDVPSNCVVAGVPAQVIRKLEE